MLCNKLITQLKQIQSNFQELNQKIDGFNDLKNSEFATEVKTKSLLDLYQSRKELKILIKELKYECFSVIKTKNYIIVEGEPTQETEIKIDFEVILASTVKFYNEHEIALPQDFEAKAKEIWTKNYEAIQKEIATHGYDNILVIPDNLPSLTELHTKMTAGYAETMQDSDFKENGSFASVKNSKSKDNSFRLILTHNIQNLEDHSLLKATIGKPPETLTGKSKIEIETIIDSQGELPVNIELEGIKFGSDKITKNSNLQAEGLTIAEYLIFQRQYFETTGNHLDVEGWTWLLATFSAHRLTSWAWYSPDNRFNVDVGDVDFPIGLWGCRPSRSFFL